MRIRIWHDTTYNYSWPVTGVIQTLRLTPRNTQGQYVMGWRIDVSADCPLSYHVDAFGNVICTHDGAVKLPGGDPHQQHMPACCSAGCSMATPANLPPPDTHALARTLAFEPVAFSAPAFRHVDFARDRSPANPRAPPVAD